MNQQPLYTIGHSTHPIEKFVELLHEHRISAIADVRSRPYSRFNPQFNCDGLQAVLKSAGIAYVFLGRELGARTDDRSCYVDSKVDYKRLAQTPLFQSGITRLKDGVRKHRIALMCAEKDPIVCHRMVLICHHLRGTSLEIGHVHADGMLETNADAERRLVAATGRPEFDLFTSQEEAIEEAYSAQGMRIAWDETASNIADEVSERPSKIESVP